MISIFDQMQRGDADVAAALSAVKLPIHLHRDPNYHNERLRVAIFPRDLKGHRVLRAGRFLMTDKKFAPDGMVILWFQNQFSQSGDGWNRVGRNGVIKVPVPFSESKAFIEDMSYTLFLYQW